MHLCNYFPHQISRTRQLGVINSRAHRGQIGNGSEWCPVRTRCSGKEPLPHLHPKSSSAAASCCHPEMRAQCCQTWDFHRRGKSKRSHKTPQFSNIGNKFSFFLLCFNGQTKPICRLDPVHRPPVCSLWPRITAWARLHLPAAPPHRQPWSRAQKGGDSLHLDW